MTVRMKIRRKKAKLTQEQKEKNRLFRIIRSLHPKPYTNLKTLKENND